MGRALPSRRTKNRVTSFTIVVVVVRGEFTTKRMVVLIVVPGGIVVKPRLSSRLLQVNTPLVLRLGGGVARRKVHCPGLNLSRTGNRVMALVPLFVMVRLKVSACPLVTVVPGGSISFFSKVKTGKACS